MKKKLDLKDLQVNSFVTGASTNTGTVKGGTGQQGQYTYIQLPTDDPFGSLDLNCTNNAGCITQGTNCHVCLPPLPSNNFINCP